MTFDLSDPRVWLLILGGTLLFFFATELFLVGRHVRKVDELAYRVHRDLSLAEDEIRALKQRLPGGRLRTMAMPVVATETDPDTQTYGRHAHPG